MATFGFCNINFICRVLENNEHMFRSEVLFRKDIVITSGKLHKDLTTCLDELKTIVLELSDVEHKGSMLMYNGIADYDNNL